MNTISMRQLAERSGIQFGTSGVRGLVSGLTDSLCHAWAQAFIRSTATGASGVVVGHDLRPSSPAIAAACVQAIRDAGLNPVFVGALPTPALAFFAAERGWPGIMVTGSHIPFDRNGIKFYRADGEIDKRDEEAILDARVEMHVDLHPAPLPPVETAAVYAYIQRYVQFFGTDALKGQQIAVYEHSSVARDVLRTVLEALGATVLSLGRTDTFVPIDTEAVRPEDIAQASAWARVHRFDALLSTDGDADRPLIGDEHGVWMRGDVVGILCAQALGADSVVTPVSSNTALELCGAFSRMVRTRIGSPYVIAGMQRVLVEAMQTATDMTSGVEPAAPPVHAPVIAGYEANGGFLLGSPIRRNGAELAALPTRDAVLPMLTLLTEAARLNVPLSALPARLPQRFTASDRIQQVPTEWSRAFIAELSRQPDSAAQVMAPLAGAIRTQDETDGLRLTFSNGDVVHLRPSGNAPELRCYAESDTVEKAHALCAACLANVQVRVAMG